MDEANKSKARSVIAHVIQNNLKGHESAISELNARIEWHQRINAWLVEAITKVTAEHHKMHVSTAPTPAELIVNQNPVFSQSGFEQS